MGFPVPHSAFRAPHLGAAIGRAVLVGIASLLVLVQPTLGATRGPVERENRVPLDPLSSRSQTEFGNEEIRVLRAPAQVPMALADAAAPRSARSRTGNDEAVSVRLQDLELVDQDGRKLKFKSDVIGDKVAVVIPFYTTCTTAYPILIFMIARLQELLGDHLNRDVVLVSVSVDPKTDIPLRLKAYARRQKARPGWVFLSGERSSLSQVLCGVGALFTSNLEEHNHIPITLVGSARGQWRRFQGFPSPEQVLEEVNESLASRAEQ